MRQQGRDREGQRILQQGLAAARGSAELHHAYGLLLIRQQKYPEAVASLAKAASTVPSGVRVRAEFLVGSSPPKRAYGSPPADFAEAQ